MAKFSVISERRDPALTMIGSRFQAFCKRHELTVFSVEAEKHGSLVWEAGRTVDYLHRYLTFSLTPDITLREASLRSVPYRASVTILVDRDTFFHFPGV